MRAALAMIALLLAPAGIARADQAEEEVMREPEPRFLGWTDAGVAVAELPVCPAQADECWTNIDARDASTTTPTRITGGATDDSTAGGGPGVGTTCGSTLGTVRQLPARPMVTLRAAAVAGPARRREGPVMSLVGSRCR